MNGNLDYIFLLLLLLISSRDDIVINLFVKLLLEREKKETTNFICLKAAISSSWKTLFFKYYSAHNYVRLFFSHPFKAPSTYRTVRGQIKQH